MTDPERPAGAPSGGPTPEEISARLEALLKRTHALRAERASSPSLGVTWPPPDRELDRYDVVDVPEDPRTPSPSTPPPTAPASTPEPPQVFARPDWSELRLRTPPADPPTRSSWLGVLTALLALLALAEGAYIWYGQATAPVVEQGRLRVDGPEGAEVRVDGQAVGLAPIDQDYPSGVYDIEVRVGSASVRAPQIPIGLGRTVVLLPMAAAAASAETAAAAPAPASQPSTDAAPGAAPAGAMPEASADVSATTGAVRIESTPPGLPVTMEGRERGVTPLTLGQLRPGRHDVLVGGTVRQVDVRAGEVATLRVSR